MRGRWAVAHWLSGSLLAATVCLGRDAGGSQEAGHVSRRAGADGTTAGPEDVWLGAPVIASCYSCGSRRRAGADGTTAGPEDVWLGAPVFSPCYSCGNHGTTRPPLNDRRWLATGSFVPVLAPARSIPVAKRAPHPVAAAGDGASNRWRILVTVGASALLACATTALWLGARLQLKMAQDLRAELSARPPIRPDALPLLPLGEMTKECAPSDGQVDARQFALHVSGEGDSDSAGPNECSTQSSGSVTSTYSCSTTTRESARPQVDESAALLKVDESALEVDESAALLGGDGKTSHDSSRTGQNAGERSTSRSCCVVA